jgi:prevent-host-death family protein
MKIASVADVKARFSAFLKSSQEGPVVVTRNGKPVAVLLSVADEEDVERLLLAYSPKFQNILQTAEQQIRDGKGIHHTDFWNEIDKQSK